MGDPPIRPDRFRESNFESKEEAQEFIKSNNFKNIFNVRKPKEGKLMKFDRPFNGLLDNKSVRIESFDIVEKILQGSLESNYKLRFETTKENERYIRNKTDVNESINFKVYVKNDEIINVNLIMKSTGFATDINLNDDKIEYVYKVISVEQ